nr:unnamed protein product [Digitaria exilis]
MPTVWIRFAAEISAATSSDREERSGAIPAGSIVRCAVGSATVRVKRNEVLDLDDDDGVGSSQQHAAAPTAGRDDEALAHLLHEEETERSVGVANTTVIWKRDEANKLKMSVAPEADRVLVVVGNTSAPTTDTERREVLIPAQLPPLFLAQLSNPPAHLYLSRGPTRPLSPPFLSLTGGPALSYPSSSSIMPKQDSTESMPRPRRPPLARTPRLEPLEPHKTPSFPSPLVSRPALPLLPPRAAKLVEPPPQSEPSRLSSPLRVRLQAPRRGEQPAEPLIPLSLALCCACDPAVDPEPPWLAASRLRWPTLDLESKKSVNPSVGLLNAGEVPVVAPPRAADSGDLSAQLDSSR